MTQEHPLTVHVCSLYTHRGFPHPCFVFSSSHRLFLFRWEGVPFLLTAGKSLDERRGHIQLHFHRPPSSSFLFGGRDVPSNNLTIELQPEQGVYFGLNVKSPGFDTSPTQTTLGSFFSLALTIISTLFVCVVSRPQLPVQVPL